MNRLGRAAFRTAPSSARAGPFGAFAPDTELARWLKTAYADRYSVPPNYASYQDGAGDPRPEGRLREGQGRRQRRARDQDKIIAAFENLTFEGPGGTVKMALGKGHQAVMDAAVGTTKVQNGKLDHRRRRSATRPTR